MKKMLISVSVVIGMSCSPAISDKSENLLVTTKTLSLDAALKVAQTAIKACNKDGYQIAVAVVDIGAQHASDCYETAMLAFSRQK